MKHKQLKIEFEEKITYTPTPDWFKCWFATDQCRPEDILDQPRELEGMKNDQGELEKT